MPGELALTLNYKRLISSGEKQDNEQFDHLQLNRLLCYDLTYFIEAREILEGKGIQFY